MPEQGKAGDISAMATLLEGIPMRGQGSEDMNKQIGGWIGRKSELDRKIE